MSRHYPVESAALKERNPAPPARAADRRISGISPRGAAANEPLSEPPRINEPRSSEMRLPQRGDEAIPRQVVSMRPDSGVLLVEDDPDTQWRLARMLTVQGARVVGTSSGESALAVLAEWPVQLILVDEGLPGMSGLELARSARAMHPEIPVVVMTDVDDEDLRIAADVAGVYDVILKPRRSEALAEVLRRLDLVSVHERNAVDDASVEQSLDEDRDSRELLEDTETSSSRLVRQADAIRPADSIPAE